MAQERIGPDICKAALSGKAFRSGSLASGGRLSVSVRYLEVHADMREFGFQACASGCDRDVCASRVYCGGRLYGVSCV